MKNRQDTGGANPSYQGYDYQKLVTVWVALQLMFGPDAWADEIVVEPASHDDVKASLAVDAEAAEANLTIAARDELHVQIKFKGSGFWSAADFAGVIEDKPATGTRGPKPRARAKAMILADAARRYVFITNTSVDDTLAKGRVKSPAQRANAQFTPTGLKAAKAERPKLAGRFALIEQMTPEETRRQIDTLLSRALKVPSQNLDACVDRLKRLVEDRFLAVPDPLRKVDIAKVAEGLGGTPHANPQLATYVPPSNRALAVQHLTALGAVLLVGPSGYGKSLTADSLAYDRRQATPPSKVVRESEGLAAIADAFAAPGPVLFHLEDPWGQSGLKKDEASQWTAKLAEMIRQRRPDKQFLITTRSEIYREALSGSPAPVWADRTVVIDDNAYDQAARLEMLHGNLKAAETWRQDLARQHENRLMRALHSPLEINAFSRELLAVSKPADADVNVLIDRAQTDSRHQVVIDQVRAFGDRGVAGAAVLWALLRYSRGLQPTRLAALRREVERSGNTNVALDDLVKHLAQTQLTLDQDGGYAAHGKVVEAFESLARDYPRAAETALNAVARAAVTLAGSDRSWLEELDRVASGISTLEAADVLMDDDVVAGLDALLLDGLFKSVGKAGAFRNAWTVAVRRLSTKSPIGKLVHWLAGEAPKGKGGFDFGWRPPKITDADRQAILFADPDLRVLKGFIAHHLPWTNDNYDADALIPWVEPFGVDLSEAFIAAGEVVVSAAGFIMSADAISEGALSWPDPDYAKVWDQIVRLDAAVSAALAASKEDRRKAWQGELDFAEGLAIQERGEEEGGAASHYAKGYMRARRRQQGFGWIPCHERPDLMIALWAEIMRSNKPKVTAAELDAYFDAAADDDALIAEGLRVIGERRLEFGRPRVLAALSGGGPRAVDAAVRALGWLESDRPGSAGKTTAETTLLQLIGQVAPAQAAHLAPRIVGMELGKGKPALAGRVLAAAAPAAQNAVYLVLARALGADDDTVLNRFRQMSTEDAQDLMMNGPRGLARLLVKIAAAEGQDILTLAGQWIRSNDEDDAQAAISALELAGNPAANAIIAQALTHADFEVRRAAVRALAPVAIGARRGTIFDLASDPSAPVRQAVANAIGKQQWDDGLDTLVALLADRRNYARHPEHQAREEPEYHVARAAAEALGALGTLPDMVLDGIIAAVDAGAQDAVDVELHAQLIALLVKQAHSGVWDAFGRWLADDHVVGQADENLYPIRYAAAWALVNRLGEKPSEIDLAPWPAVELAASHADPQLAAPALLALGCKMSVACDADALTVLRGASASEARVALALAMIDDRDAARALSTTYGLLPPDHPLFDQGPDVSTDAATFNRWPISANGVTWLENLKASTDVEAVLLWVIGARTGLDLVEETFDPASLRRRESIPIMTFAEMFGME